jgi:thiol-disulfide isomerase/thioredoxin
MIRIHCSITNRVIAVAALVFVLGLPKAGAGQTEASGPDAAKTDAAKPETTKAEAAKPGVAGNDTARPDEPTDPKARKTYASAIDSEKHGHDAAALDDFRKANKQDGGQCWECLRRAYSLAAKLGAYKDAAEIARDLLPLAQTNPEKASIHFGLAMALQEQGIQEKKDKYFPESGDEFKAALQFSPKFARAHYHYGVTLAYLHQDDAARSEFSAFLNQDHSNPTMHPRAERFVDRVELARATMAPPFEITTLNGQHLSMDSLAGKVVLIDFWATWCGPCREALPHIQAIAKKFEGQPLVVLSISQDTDQDKWKTFVAKNGMTWLQYCDGAFPGRIGKQFNVNAIPATFTIDADGVLEDQHVGDADIEGKLKKLIARAVEMGNRAPVTAAADKASGSGQ